jgi:serpin B
MINNRIAAALLAAVFFCDADAAFALQRTPLRSDTGQQIPRPRPAKSLAVLQTRLSGFGLDWASHQQPGKNVLLAAAPLLDTLVILEMAASGNTGKQIRAHLKTSVGIPLIEQRNAAVLSGSPLVPTLGLKLADNKPYGLRVEDHPANGSPAWTAGLRKGDLIFSIDGLPARDLQSFNDLVRDSPDSVQLGLFSVEEGLVDEDREVKLSAVYNPSASPKSWPARTAAAVWVSSKFATAPEFQRTVRQLHGVGFATSGSETPEEITQSLQTALPEFPGIRLPDLPQQPAFVIFNTQQIRLRWKIPFDPGKTQPGPFRTSRQPQLVKLMSSLSVHRYYETSDLRILDLDADGSDLFCRLVLPRDDSTEISKPGTMVVAAASVRPVDMQQPLVDLRIPRFHFSSRFSLRNLLETAGVLDAWTNRADFSRLDPLRRILLTDVVQDAEVHVDEFGMRLDSAVTAVGGFKGTEPDPDVVFHADRPFIFVVQNSKGFIFAAGVVEQPEN